MVRDRRESILDVVTDGGPMRSLRLVFDKEATRHVRSRLVTKDIRTYRPSTQEQEDECDDDDNDHDNGDLWTIGIISLEANRDRWRR